uniref:FecR protein domain-containing protein n=1 Tax=Magnetococcus massalia (strain MO-1) TaxID=451514 RepID=A0A1S7LIG8_MAGMO|nr:protein of unknown function [Candidatus Magnetococcus massalia]
MFYVANISFDHNNLWQRLARDTRSEMHNQASGGADSVLIAEPGYLTQGDLQRVGEDLVITHPTGSQLVISGYFAQEPSPLLRAPGGATWTPEMVNLLLPPENFGQDLAEQHPGTTLSAGTDSGEQTIGTVSEISGRVVVKGMDGSLRIVEAGDVILFGDVVRTAEGQLKVTLNDGGSFQLGRFSQTAFDSLSFDPAQGLGKFNATVLGGFFSYKSGEIGELHAEAHSTIRTPAAMIAVRGSELDGEVNEDGQTTVVHKDGILDVSDLDGNGVVSLLEPGQATSVTFGEAPEPVFRAPKDLLDRFNQQLPTNIQTQTTEGG